MSKKSLTPEEVLMVAHGAITYGISQHHIAGMYGVDSGRVAEAVVAMRWAMENHRDIYKSIQKAKKNGIAKDKPLAPTPIEEYIASLLPKPTEATTKLAD
jgi:peptide subunit release factor RF-3